MLEIALKDIEILVDLGENDDWPNKYELHSGVWDYVVLYKK